MNRIRFCTTVFLAAFGLLLSREFAQATQARETVPTPAELSVEDSGSLFSSDAITKAKKTVAESKGKGSRQVHIETFNKISDAEEKELTAAGNDKDKVRTFWNKWGRSKVVNEHGIMILVVRHPGHVQPLVSGAMREAGFTEAKEEKITTMLLDTFHKAKKAKDDGKSDEEQQKIRDDGLQELADYLKTELPTSVVQKGSASDSRSETSLPPVSHESREPQGMGIGGWICIGIVAIAGIWLVVGLIRAFSGGGSGGGMGMGGGGGGSGFFPGLMGGLFGGMAGAWIYDRFFGGGGSSAWGSGPSQHGGGFGSGDYYGGSADNSGGGDVDMPGGGDFSGDTGGGGDFGGDIGGGGDFGGGGGDSGGGGGGDF